MAEYTKLNKPTVSLYDYYRRNEDGAIFACPKNALYAMAAWRADMDRPLFVTGTGLYVPIVGEFDAHSSVCEPVRHAKDFLPYWKAWGGTITMPLQLRDLIEAIADFRSK